jgi:hypothetical protein
MSSELEEKKQQPVPAGLRHLSKVILQKVQASIDWIEAPCPTSHTPVDKFRIDDRITFADEFGNTVHATIVGVKSLERTYLVRRVEEEEETWMHEYDLKLVEEKKK